MSIGDPAKLSLDLDLARAAGVRYQKSMRTRPRDLDVADGRKQHLKASLTRATTRALIAEAESHGPAAGTAQTLATLAQERIVGASDLRDINYLEVAIAVARGVCRIRVGPAAGSGVLVGPRLLMTNHHVLPSRDEAVTAEAQFDYQDDSSGDLLPVHAYGVDPESFWVTDEALDFTIVALQDRSSKGQPLSRYPWAKLLATVGKAEAGDPVNIIQHPRGGLKQVALRNNEVVLIPAGKPSFLYYTTDTEPGSSGSPCFNDQWELIALHHSGVPRMRGNTMLKRDGSAWSKRDDPALIDWIANEGARVSAVVESLQAMNLPSEQRDMLHAALEGTVPNPVEVARTSATSSTAAPARTTRGKPSTAPGSVSISVPLTITVTLDGTVAQATVSGGAVKSDDAVHDTPEPTEKLVVDPDWSTRKGYDAEFLGETVPLPTMSAAMRADSVEVPARYRVNGDSHVLAYHHFSLAMNAKRRFAWYSAANVDGSVRPSLPKRAKDEWYVDARIDDPKAPRFQCGEDLYAASNTDRGHLTRYLDVAWGSRKEALKALADSFHFTNSCLQLSGFNQAQARWQGIEQFLLERKARKEKRRISVITGPIFKTDDPKYKNGSMSAPVRIPLEFWKVCALIRPNGTLSATAFILSQSDIASLPGFEAFLDVAEVQTTIRNVEKLTGLRFKVLRDNDHLAKGGAAGTLELAGQTVIPLRTYDDIVV